MRIEEFDNLDEVRRLAAMDRDQQGALYRIATRMLAGAIVILLVIALVMICLSVLPIDLNGTESCPKPYGCY